MNSAICKFCLDTGTHEVQHIEKRINVLIRCNCIRGYKLEIKNVPQWNLYISEEYERIPLEIKEFVNEKSDLNTAIEKWNEKKAKAILYWGGEENG